MGFFSAIGSFIMTPLYYAISAIMLAWHKLFTAIGMDPAGERRGRCRSSA